MTIADVTGARQPKLYFKHLYGGDAYKWGVIGFPNTQSPSSALRGYKRGDLVFLAVTKSEKQVAPEWAAHAGKVLGVCTLHFLDRATSELANPQMMKLRPEVAGRWNSATQIVQFWSFDEPFSYDSVGDLEFLKCVQTRRGQMIGLKSFDRANREFKKIYVGSSLTEQQVYMSKAARNLVNLLMQTHVQVV